MRYSRPPVLFRRHSTPGWRSSSIRPTLYRCAKKRLAEPSDREVRQYLLVSPVRLRAGDPVAQHQDFHVLARGLCILPVRSIPMPESRAQRCHLGPRCPTCHKTGAGRVVGYCCQGSCPCRLVDRDFLELHEAAWPAGAVVRDRRDETVDVFGLEVFREAARLATSRTSSMIFPRSSTAVPCLASRTAIIGRG
jgi:hypothetical protein